MKLKLITLTALTALSLGGVALAQDQDTNAPQRRGGRGRHDMMENMTQSLNLTPDQKTKIQPILDEAKPKMEAIHRDAMEKSRALMEDTKAKIRPLLTPEQQKTLDDMKNNRRGHKGRHGGGNGGGDEGDNG
jgi:Spy/CpxP family protein refolding chaperone